MVSKVNYAHLWPEFRLVNHIKNNTDTTLGPGEPLDSIGDVGRKGWLRLRSLAGASQRWQIGQKGLPGTGQARGEGKLTLLEELLMSV